MISEPPWDEWTEQDDKPYVVYGLVHPMTLQCFYVGITTDLYKRFIQHISCKQDTPEKNEIILDLKRQNLIPDCVLLASGLHEHEAKRSEAFVTDLYRQMKQPLANQTLWCGYDPTEIEKTYLARSAEAMQKIASGRNKSGMGTHEPMCLSRRIVYESFEQMYTNRWINTKNFEIRLFSLALIIAMGILMISPKLTIWFGFDQEVVAFLVILLLYGVNASTSILGYYCAFKNISYGPAFRKDIMRPTEHVFFDSPVRISVPKLSMNRLSLN